MVLSIGEILSGFKLLFPFRVSHRCATLMRQSSSTKMITDDDVGDYGDDDDDDDSDDDDVNDNDDGDDVDCDDDDDDDDDDEDDQSRRQGKFLQLNKTEF